MRCWPCLAAVALLSCAVFMTSQLSGEPIPASEDLSAPSASSAAAKSQSPDIAEAIAKFKANDFDGALKLWKAVVKTNADMPPAQVVMASQFFQANMPDRAKAALESAIADAPNDPEAYLLLGGIMLRDGDVSKADPLLQKAEGLMPAFQSSEKRKNALSPQLHANLAAVAEARGDWAESQKHIETLLKLEPQNTVAMQKLAFCFLKQNDAEKALEKLREAAKLDSDLPPPETLLSQFYQRLNDRKNADKWIAAALATSPKNIKTRLMASQYALETGKLDEARRQSIAATRLDSESLEAKLLQGEIANYEMNFEGAELFFEAVLKRSPDNLPASNNLALALISQDDKSKRQRALEIAEGNFKKYPKMAQVASTHGIVLYRLGRLDEAEMALAGAVSIKETDPETAYVFARIAADRGHKAEAVRLLGVSLKGIRPFMYRQEAEELLERLTANRP